MSNLDSYVFYNLLYDHSVQVIVNNETSFIINLYSNKALPFYLKIIKLIINIIVGIIALILLFLVIAGVVILLGPLLFLGFVYWLFDILNSRLRVKYFTPIISKKYEIVSFSNRFTSTDNFIRVKKLGVINFQDKKELQKFFHLNNIIKEKVYDDESIYYKFNSQYIGSLDFPVFITETGELELVFDLNLIKSKIFKNSSEIREFFKIIYTRFPVLFIRHNCGYLLTNNKFILSRIPILPNINRYQDIEKFNRLVEEFDSKKTM